MFRSADEVLHILGNILGSLQRGRTSLIVPRKSALYDLMKSRNMVYTSPTNNQHQRLKTNVLFQKSLSPSLSEDLAVSFYIQSHKLILAVYQLSTIHGTMKYEATHAEGSVDWLNEILVFFTIALQLCQQLKDKVGLFYLWICFVYCVFCTSKVLSSINVVIVLVFVVFFFFLAGFGKFYLDL